MEASVEMPLVEEAVIVPTIVSEEDIPYLLSDEDRKAVDAALATVDEDYLISMASDAVANLKGAEALATVDKDYLISMVSDTVSNLKGAEASMEGELLLKEEAQVEEEVVTQDIKNELTVSEYAPTSVLVERSNASSAINTIIAVGNTVVVEDLIPHCEVLGLDHITLYSLYEDMCEAEVSHDGTDVSKQDYMSKLKKLRAYINSYCTINEPH